MSVEQIILIASSLIILFLLWWLVPRDKVREAWVAFLFKQIITWLAGLWVVEIGWITYPVRWFPYATRSSFNFEYLIYPALCVFFNLYYPKNSTKLRKTVHYLLYCGGITLLELYFEQYTKLIEYNGWTGYWTFITLWISFYISRKFYLWFFKEKI